MSCVSWRKRRLGKNVLAHELYEKQFIAVIQMEDSTRFDFSRTSSRESWERYDLEHRNKAWRMKLDVDEQLSTLVTIALIFSKISALPP